VDAGLGACLFGLFEHEAAVLAALGVPDGWRAVGTVAIGHPAPDADAQPGRSASRGRRPLDEVLHRGGW
jgi:nitroreductase